MEDDGTKCSAVTVAVLVLAGCHLSLTLSKVPPPHDGGGQPARVEPAGHVASLAATVLAAYVASAACAGGGRIRLSLGSLLAEARRTWARPAATALYIELLTTAMASLLLTLRAFLAAAASAGGATAGLMAVSGSVALVGWLGPVLFAHSDIACRMSLVVAAAEEGYGGAAAVRRAEALVAGRRAHGIAIGLLASAIEQAPTWLCGDGVPALVVGPAVLAAKIVACCACSAFYYDCRRRHDKVSASRSTAKCCQVLWDRDLYVTDESEEEFGGSFECFRLT
ncbi:hypothetical protein EJB05_41783, partial [Eragrostis curvula]